MKRESTSDWRCSAPSLDGSCIVFRWSPLPLPQPLPVKTERVAKDFPSP